MAKTFVQESGMFRLEVSVEDDLDFDFSHYGRFCELERNRYGEGPTRPRNSPDGGDFYIRNPGAWVLRDEGNGTDSWVRGDRTVYGWFKLNEHPKHAVEYLMKEEGLSEREAWRKELDRLSTLVGDLSNGNVWAVVLSVVVYWEDVIVGETCCGGIEANEYIDEEGALALAREFGMIEEAMDYARQRVAEMCKEGLEITRAQNEAQTAPDNREPEAPNAA